MSLNRVKAIWWRHAYDLKHNVGRLFDTFYWPALDIVLWGMTSVYFQQKAATADIVLVLLSGLVFWQVIWRSQYEVTVNLLEELWSHNLVNVLATPLTIYEWVVAVICLGFIRMFFAIGFGLALVYWLYGVNILQVGWMMVPFVALLLMSGWDIGLVAAGVILRFGMRIEVIAWSGVSLLAPFSAIYYPVSTLPEWGQRIAAWVPASYVFEGMRVVLSRGQIDQAMLLKSLGLTVIYLVLGLGFFWLMYQQRRKLGVSSLE